MVAGTEFAAFVISGAGCGDANGLYLPTGKTLFQAPVFANDQKCLLSREPHRDSATGRTSFGWVLGQDRKPLYASRSESLSPPLDGWGSLLATLPAPTLQEMEDEMEAATLAAQLLKEEGNALFGFQKYIAAVQKWERALGLVEVSSSGEELVATLHANLSEARLRQQQWGKAMDEAEKALRCRPHHEKALLRAATAARKLGRYADALEFAQRCVSANPQQVEAKRMVLAVEQLLVSEERKLAAGRDGKVHEDWTVSMEEQPSRWDGVVEGTMPPEPLELDLLPQIKKEYKDRAAEDLHLGKIQALEALLPSEVSSDSTIAVLPPSPRDRRKTAIAAEPHLQPSPVELSKADTGEIDGLFSSFR